MQPRLVSELRSASQNSLKITSNSSIFHFLSIKGKANNPSKQNKVKFCPITKASSKFDLPHMFSLKFSGFTHIKPCPSNNQGSLSPLGTVLQKCDLKLGKTGTLPFLTLQSQKLSLLF